MNGAAKGSGASTGACQPSANSIEVVQTVAAGDRRRRRRLSPREQLRRRSLSLSLPLSLLLCMARELLMRAANGLSDEP